MVCSLGHDIDTACAAARAGLGRLGTMPFGVMGGDGAPAAAIGHGVFGLTDGFEGDARLIRLCGQAARNLFEYPAVAANQLGKMGWFLALPSATRRLSGLDRISEDARALYEENLPKSPVAATDSARGERIIRASLEMAGVSPTLNRVRVSTAGRVGFGELVDTAAQELEAGTLDTAIVGGVDSLVSEPELAWLNITGRLKTDEQSAGLVPGEAAALIFLKKTGNVYGSQTSALANLHSVQHAQTRRPYSAGEAPDGDGLAEALFPLAEAQCVNSQTPWIVTDQNGENYRAADWGHAFVRLLTRYSNYENVVLWHPAVSFGDTGAASAAVGVCMALRAYARNYAPNDIAVVVSSSDGPERAALIVEKTER